MGAWEIPCSPTPRPGSLGEPPSLTNAGLPPRFRCGLGPGRPNAPDLGTLPPTQQAPRTPCARCSGPPCLSPCSSQRALGSDLLSPLSSHVPSSTGAQSSRPPKQLTC